MYSGPGAEYGSSARIKAIAVHPTKPNRVMAGMGNAIGYQPVTLTSSFNGGVTWADTRLSDYGEVRAILFNPLLDGQILLGGATGISGGGPVIWRSLDDGATWAEVFSGTANYGMAVSALAMNDVSPTLIYAGSGSVYGRDNSGPV